MPPQPTQRGRSCSVCPENEATDPAGISFDSGAPPDRRLVATVDLVEQLGSDVLVRAIIDTECIHLFDPATGLAIR
jgi:hypothetical protein